MVRGLTYPYYVMLTFYRSSKKKFDYINAAQILLDAMRDARYFTDDDMKCVVPVFYPYEVDTQNPRTIIHVIRDNNTYIAMLNFLTEKK